jgi:TonB family protein
MKVVYCLCLCLVSFVAVCQQPIYKEFEVDSAALPRGGMDYINIFLQTNLRKPVQAESEGIGGRVLVQAVVEPDGHITEVKLLKSLRPDLDREALRVFRLFNAWKPAQKGGVAVRQLVMYPVVFARNAPFTYENGQRTDYYGADMKLTADAATATYKQVMPIDSMGIPNDDMLIYEQKGTKWSKVNRLTLVRQAVSEYSSSGKPVQRVGYKNAAGQWIYHVYELTTDGQLISKTHYADNNTLAYPVRYHDNGAVAETSSDETGRILATSWYPNGQIRQIRFDQGQFDKRYKFERVQDYWRINGEHTVVDGNGKVTLESMRQSATDLAKQTRYIETGEYLDGKQQGLWSGYCEDGSFSYEELYDRGILQSGKSRRGNSSPVVYTTQEQLPEFPGGMPGLGTFLSRNLRYPVDAQKSGQQGQVIVSFVVCTDGTLCDYEVVKGVSSSINWEALRVVKAMSGKWKPGIQRGEPVRVKYNMPINFTLE